MVLGKRWLFLIGNAAEIRPLEMGRKGTVEEHIPIPWVRAIIDTFCLVECDRAILDTFCLLGHLYLSRRASLIRTKSFCK